MVEMGRPVLLIYTSVVAMLTLALTCRATVYTVGDSSGWDISTDLNTWENGKHFVVGDVLSFQYSSSDTVNEVTKENYDGCNTTNVIQSYTTGNTTIPLTKPGDRYFVSGNKLYCLGGMKLDVHVDGNQTASPAGAPAAQSESGADLPTATPSSKSNNPSSVVPSSAVFNHGGLLGSFVMFVSALFWVV